MSLYLPDSAASMQAQPKGRPLFSGLCSAALALAMAMAAIPGAGAQTVFRVAYPETENPPRISGSGPGVPAEKPGITIELLRMAAEKAGVTLEIARVPWKRCLYLVENAYVDGTFHASFTEERARYAVYPTRNGKVDASRAIYLNRYALYARKGTDLRWDGRALSNVRKPIGTLSGNAAVDDLKKQGVAVEEAPGVRSNMEKLKADRISAYVEIEGIGEEFLAEHREEFADIQKLPLPFQEKHYFVVISKNYYQQHPELAEAIFDAIRDVQLTPAYRKMVQKYK